MHYRIYYVCYVLSIQLRGIWLDFVTEIHIPLFYWHLNTFRLYILKRKRLILLTHVYLSSFLRYPYNMLLLETLCAVTAVISIYIYGNQSWYAPLFGFFSQIFWVAWAILDNHYAMLFLSGAMILTHIRNCKQMKTIQKLKQKLYSKT